MKKIILLFLLSFSFVFLRAGEGMWIPLLLNWNESEMKAMGMKLSADDLYSINHSSLKDAVVHFNGGCTGEIISPEGLLITNHHCGYSEIQSHSTVQNDYLTNGFWAKSKMDELPGGDLYVSIIVEIRNVTDSVLFGVKKNMTESERQKKVEENSKKINIAAIQGTGYESYIKPFYYGNEYYLFIVETFEDIRLVGAPPSSIGKFGGDTDNWMWPRHTGDFSLFRIYAGKDNKPAKYSSDNVPYKPKHFFPVSLKGVSEGDFTIVYGFPGRTQEYLFSVGVNYVMNFSNPVKIKMREIALSIMNEDMRASNEIRIKYAAKNARIANYWKKWIGESRGLKKFNAVEKKKKLESDLINQAKNSMVYDFDSLFPKFHTLYIGLAKVGIPLDYYNEAVNVNTELLRFTSAFFVMEKECENKNLRKSRLDTLLGDIKASSKSFFKDYNKETDKKIFTALFQMFYEGVDNNIRMNSFKDVEENFFKKKNPSEKKVADFKKFADFIFEKSIFADEKKLTEFLGSFKRSQYKKIKNDPAFSFAMDLNDYFGKIILPQYDSINGALYNLYRVYIAGLKKLNSDSKKYYPDANGTLRVAYGKVQGSEPADGVTYNYYTSIDGIIEKADSLNDEFRISPTLRECFNKKDYGGYDKNGKLVVCFTASNHTTGGNSGSPVIDANGYLIGVNFDRTWESTMSDLMFDPDRCRNIVLDMGYVLFVMDKICGAKNLIEEMKIIR